MIAPRRVVTMQVRERPHPVVRLQRVQVAPRGVMEDGHVTATVAGTPQGGVISSLLSNIYLHVLHTV